MIVVRYEAFREMVGDGLPIHARKGFPYF